MRTDGMTKTLLALLVLGLWALLLRPLFSALPAQAQGDATSRSASSVTTVGNYVVVVRERTISAWRLRPVPITTPEGRTTFTEDKRELVLLDRKTLP